MENFKAFPSTSKVTDHFQFIPFVSSSEDVQIEFNQETPEHGVLNGEEASQFYKEVISTPALNIQSSLVNVPHKQPKIVQKKSKPILPDYARLSIFHHAQNGCIEGIEYHLSKEMDVNVQDIYGWTPLMCATFEGHCNVVEYLIKNKANLDLKNKQGLTALDIALSKENAPLIDLLSKRIKEEPIDEDCEIQELEKYCGLCNCSFTESTVKHERSIAHLFSSSNNNGESVSTYYHIPENNKGFQIMLKKGWDKNKGLGADAKGRKFPVKTVLKTDRSCIGGKKEVSKITHFSAHDHRAVKSNIQPTLNLKRETKLNKRKMKKVQERNRKFEIEFRRQFHLE